MASVVEQDDAGLEVIVVDDGSTDDTPRIAAELGCRFGDKLRVIRKPNEGPGAARNTGAAVSKGEYLLFLDADDRILPGGLGLFRSGIASAPEAGLVFGGYVSKRIDGSRSYRPAPQAAEEPMDNFKLFALDQLCVCNGGAILLKRDVLDSVQYPTSIRTREDFVFFAQAFARFKAVSVVDPVVEIRKHAGSLRHNYDNLQFAVDTAHELLFDPDVLPEECFRLRSRIDSLWYLTVARAFHGHGRHGEAKRAYRKAIDLYPLHLLKLGYLAKFLKSLPRH